MMKKARLEFDTKQDEISEDWISRLPDDILVNIISRLNLDEAARTSVLSSRWKYLWTFITSLDFDGSELLKSVSEDTIVEERASYINWVNKVLESHRGFSLNEFIISFDLDASHESNITNWIHTAISKRVQKLELNLLPALCWPPPPGIYTLTQECYDNLKSPHGLSCIKNLRSLYFDTVNVTGDVLEFFIYNCPYLDELRVGRSDNLLRLKVVGSLTQLKCLEIDCCSNLEELEISCPSLLSFKYYGPKIKYNIKNVPRLYDVAIGGGTEGHGIGVERVLGPIVSYFPQLKTLELHVDVSEENIQFPQCELPQLRHLTFIVSAHHCNSLLGLTRMMNSCPILQKLTLKLEVFNYCKEITRPPFPNDCHRHLKVVELIGFSGHRVELQLAVYFLGTANMLEEMHIEVEPWEYKLDANIHAARRRAEKLEQVLPPRVKLVIN